MTNLHIWSVVASSLTPHQERNKSEKFLFLVSFYLFFCVRSQNYVPPLHVFHVEKVEKNVESYCKLVTFSFKFVAVCHYILQVVCHLLQVACHYEFTRNCKFLHVLHVVHPFHIIIFFLCFDWVSFCFKWIKSPFYM